MRFAGLNRTCFYPGDRDVLAYVHAGSIQDSDEIQAVEKLTQEIKHKGVWSKLARIYPISPTSLSAASICLKTRKTITWVNGPTHSSTGVTFDGSTQYGDTNFTPSEEPELMPLYDGHVSVYNQTAILDNDTETFIGAINSAGNAGIIIQSEFDLSVQSYMFHDTFIDFFPFVSYGNYIASMRSATDHELYQGGFSVATASDTADGTAFDASIWLGMTNGIVSYPGAYKCAFATIGRGLTDQEQFDLNFAIERYQQDLGRFAPQ